MRLPVAASITELLRLCTCTFASSVSPNNGNIVPRRAAGLLLLNTILFTIHSKIKFTSTCTPVSGPRTVPEQRDRLVFAGEINGKVDGHNDCSRQVKHS